ncbi:hypothetical protein SODG_004781 [Sodalis praecaptivus]
MRPPVDNGLLCLNYWEILGLRCLRFKGFANRCNDYCSDDEDLKSAWGCVQITY